MSKFIPSGMGWRPDLPDPRDYTPWQKRVLPLLRHLKRRRGKSYPKKVDIRRDADGDYFTPPEDQGPLGCSSAWSVLSLIEYFERRCCGRTFEGSALFLYKVARNLARQQNRVTGDTGSDLRTTLKAVARFGVPGEQHWPYDVDRFDEEPSAFLYALAQSLSRIRYFRLDARNGDGARTLQVVKSFLAAGFPVAFGFSVPTSLNSSPYIPFRPDLDSLRGGQAVVAVGYSEKHPGPTKQVLLVRSSWGTAWGDAGYGWLPCAYLRNGLARDCWTLVRRDWVESDEFSLPTVIDSREETRSSS